MSAIEDMRLLCSHVNSRVDLLFGCKVCLCRLCVSYLFPCGCAPGDMVIYSGEWLEGVMWWFHTPLGAPCRHHTDAYTAGSSSVSSRVFSVCLFLLCSSLRCLGHLPTPPSFCCNAHTIRFLSFTLKLSLQEATEYLLSFRVFLLEGYSSTSWREACPFFL